VWETYRAEGSTPPARVPIVAASIDMASMYTTPSGSAWLARTNKSAHFRCSMISCSARDPRKRTTF